MPAEPDGVLQYECPSRFEPDIRAFEEADRLRPPPPEPLLFVGSSSITLWNDLLPVEMKPLPVVSRGFGGCTYHDLVHFADRVVLRYRPACVVVYAGDNDMADGLSAERVFKECCALVDLIGDSLPRARVFLLSVKPSPARWNLWPEMRRLNASVVELCATRPRLSYIDLSEAMLSEGARPRPELFCADGLHLNAAGYELWKGILRRHLLALAADSRVACASLKSTLSET
jgi:lysophospholipase L1-like esterase